MSGRHVLAAAVVAGVAADAVVDEATEAVAAEAAAAIEDIAAIAANVVGAAVVAGGGADAIAVDSRGVPGSVLLRWRSPAEDALSPSSPLSLLSSLSLSSPLSASLKYSLSLWSDTTFRYGIATGFAARARIAAAASSLIVRAVAGRRCHSCPSTTSLRAGTLVRSTFKVKRSVS